MRVLFDARYVRVGAHDGISRFSVGLVSELAKLMPVSLLISDPRQLEHLPELPVVHGPKPTALGEPWLARKLNRLGFDVVVSPMQTMGSFGRNYRLVLTVHDLIYYEHRTPPRDLNLFIRALWRLYHLAWWPQRLLLDRADAIITVSETSKRLLRKHGLTRRQVVVVPNAAEPLPKYGRAANGIGAMAARGGGSLRLVYMGSFMPYKNVDALVRAVELLPMSELHLLSHCSQQEQERLRQLAPGATLIFHNGVSDADYAAELSAATALVSASKAEGFGIPLIEAGLAATPIAVSDIEIFREIGGDAAIFFDPDDPEQLARSLDELRMQERWRARSKASLHNAKRYSWASSAQTLRRLILQLGEKQ